MQELLTNLNTTQVKSAVIIISFIKLLVSVLIKNSICMDKHELNI